MWVFLFVCLYVFNAKDLKTQGESQNLTSTPIISIPRMLKMCSYFSGETSFQRYEWRVVNWIVYTLTFGDVINITECQRTNVSDIIKNVRDIELDVFRSVTRKIDMSRNKNRIIGYITQIKQVLSIYCQITIFQLYFHIICRTCLIFVRSFYIV